MGYRAQLLEAVLDVNRRQALKIVEMARRKLGGLRNKRVAVLGLAFKPGTDDVRDSPALKVIDWLLKKGSFVNAYDPKATPNAEQILRQGIKYCSSATEAINDCDCILILTEWDQFRDESLYRGKVVIDGRRLLDPQKARIVCDYQGICW